MGNRSEGVGRPAEFSDEQIVAAGQRLEAQGVRVNAYRIRIELGGGNATRIHDVWAEHVKKRGNAAHTAIKDLPFELVPHANAIAEQAARDAERNSHAIYRQIYEELNGRLTAEFKDRLEVAEDDLKSAKDLIRTLEADLKDAGLTIERLNASNRALEERNAGLVERAGQQKEAADIARTDARDAHARAVEMVAAAREETAKEKARSTALEDELLRLRKTIEGRSG